MFKTTIPHTVLLLLALSPLETRAQSNCDASGHVSAYHKESGDRSDSRHLSFVRPFDGTGHLVLSICAGEVRILPSTDGRLHVEVELRTNTPSDLTSYVTQLNHSSTETGIQLSFAKAQRPFIAVRIPSTTGLKSLIRLGSGQLSVRGDCPMGNREFDVGSGNLKIYLKGNTQFAELRGNVGLGSFHDRRPGGTNSHFSAKRRLEGTGAGQLDANVGTGSIELLREE